MAEVLKITDLSFSYDTKTILQELNLTVKEKEFATIIGENGAGKSTLMNLILGNLKPDSGEIKLFGDLITKNNHYCDIAYISQNSVPNYKNFPTTIEEVVKVHLKHLKVKLHICDALKKVGLEEHSKKKLSELSGGQLQRVALLLALIKDAKLILLDEPTTGIDKKFSTEFYRILKELSKNGKTIVMITHHLAETEEFIDRLFKLEGGKCIELNKNEWNSEIC